MRNFLHAIDASDMVKSINRWREATVQAEYLENQTGRLVSAIKTKKLFANESANLVID